MKNDTYLYPLQDLLYRTTALSDSDGLLREAYDTDAYGNTLIFRNSGSPPDPIDWTSDSTSNFPTCPFIFTSQRYDAETQLYYYKERYYFPRFGRFVSRDKAGYVNGINLYQIAYSRSLSLLDPVGRSVAEYLDRDIDLFFETFSAGISMGCGKQAHDAISAVVVAKNQLYLGHYLDMTVSSIASIERGICCQCSLRPDIVLTTGTKAGIGWIFEIKPATVYGFLRGPGQLERYVKKLAGCFIKVTPGGKLPGTKGGPIEIAGCGSLTWVWLAPGLIYYKYGPTPQRKTPTTAPKTLPPIIPVLAASDAGSAAATTGATAAADTGAAEAAVGAEEAVGGEELLEVLGVLLAL